MSFFGYMRKSLWELFFVTLSSVCVGVCLAEGFIIPPELEGRFFPAFLMCLALSLLAFAFAYSKKTALPGMVLLALGVIVSAVMLHRGAGALGLYAAIICCTCLGVFFVSRTRIGAALLIGFGALIITGEMLFQYGSHTALLILFFLSSVCLALCRVYNSAMLRSSTRKAAYSRHAITSIAVCLLAGVLAGAAYFAVIKPLAPPSYDIALRTELQRLPILEKLGVASRIYLPDPQRKTSEVHESDYLSDFNNEDGKDEEKSPPASPDGMEEAYSSLPLIPVPTKAINYFVRSRIWLYAACLLPLCVLAAVAARLTLRRGRLRRICRMPAQEQLAEIYPAALNALEKCGLPAIGSSSPSEYCELHKNRISRILPDFAALTQAFERAFYGGIDPSGKEQTEYLALYRRLPSICRANVGMLRYTALFFRV